ncbi:hypothetical protein KKB83_05620 [Patescibacteria group bacterium]|nr:hypothetical protein [Patescibacteria group bacterium]
MKVIVVFKDGTEVTVQETLTNLWRVSLAEILKNLAANNTALKTQGLSGATRVLQVQKRVLGVWWKTIPAGTIFGTTPIPHEIRVTVDL